MPKFSPKSEMLLSTCHQDLQRVLREAIKYVDFSVIEGHRAAERQKQLVAEGKSQTMNSKHLSLPSQAVDIAPYPIDWNDRERFIVLGYFILGLANSMGVKLRWGGLWDNKDVASNKFFDGPHFEIA